MDGAIACSGGFAPGAAMDRDELISKAATIVLVRVRALKHDKPFTVYTMETLEIIKGSAPSSYQYKTLGWDPPNPSDNDFTGHTTSAFWEKEAGRSKWYVGACGPQHAFRYGQVYLHFPDKPGAWKAAEIIRDERDRWLQYVRSKVRAAANPALRPAR
jgi:hypothetical protein